MYTRSLFELNKAAHQLPKRKESVINVVVHTRIKNHITTVILANQNVDISTKMLISKICFSKKKWSAKTQQNKVYSTQANEVPYLEFLEKLLKQTMNNQHYVITLKFIQQNQILVRIH